MRHTKPIIALFALVAAFSVTGDVFRVESRNTVPQITRDGQPVPARMLYVSKTPQEIAEVGPEWNDFELEFSILRSCPEAAIHLRFFSLADRREPENIWFSKIELYDQTAKKAVKVFRFDDVLDPDITYWCTGRNANPPIKLANVAEPGIPGGALRISSQGDPQGKLGQFHVILRNLTVEKEHDYVLRCRARAERRQVLTSSVYHQTATPQPLAYPGNAVRNQVRLAMEAGVDFVTFPLDNLWIEPGVEPDYSAIGRIYRTILAINPNAKLIPRVDLRVPPAWWSERYPGEMMKFAAGGNLGYPSIASEQYRRDAAAALRGLIRYSETNFGANMAGYHPTGGNTHEWFYLRSPGRIVSGYDDATRRTWREYLHRQYGSDAALQKAWKDSRVTLDSAEVPLPAERQAERPTVFLEPAADRPLIDFHLYLQEAMTDTILSLARVIREETGSNRLSIAFYGYLFEHAGIANGPAVSGHYALRRLLDSADIDIVSGPISYHDRQLGGISTTMTAADSVTLAGKLWLNEDDTSTHVAYRNGNRSPGWKTGATAPEQSIALLRRNLAVAVMADADRPGSAPLSPLCNLQQTREAAKNAEFVIVALHGGHEHNPFPSPRLQELCRAFADAGADLVFNCHTHCPEGVEYYHGAQIVYSPGNLYFPKYRRPLWNTGYLVRCGFDLHGVYELGLLPYRFDQRKVTPLGKSERPLFECYMERLCAPLADPERMRKLFEAWSTRYGHNYLSGVLKEIPQGWDECLEDSEAVGRLLGLRNLFTCESHHDMIRCYLRLVEEHRVAEAAELLPEIASFGSPEWMADLK